MNLKIFKLACPIWLEIITDLVKIMSLSCLKISTDKTDFRHFSIAFESKENLNPFFMLKI